MRRNKRWEKRRDRINKKKEKTRLRAGAKKETEKTIDGRSEVIVRVGRTYELSGGKKWDMWKGWWEKWSDRKEK